MSKINTNMAGVTTLYHLRNKEEGMNKALERISSGLRLNHAVDDAAGASIVNRMTSQIKGLEAAIRNAADAISLTQTAEGAIDEVTQILHRMRELSVQSANGVYTGQDRQAIQNEVGALQEELHRIAESSTFNGVKMLNGSFLDTTFQVGFQPNDTATLSIEDVKPTGLGEYILKTSVTNAENYLIDETSPEEIGTTSSHIENKGSHVSVDIFENEVISIHTINQTVSGNAVTGIATDLLKAFVAADTGTTGGFSLEAADGQTGSVIDVSKFEIDNTTGEISLPSSVTELDFEDNASAAGNNNFLFKVVYTNSDGVKFSENMTVTVKNQMNDAGTSAVNLKSATADNSPATVLRLSDLSPDLLFQAQALGMTVNADGTMNATNFTGSFATSTSLTGASVNSTTGDLTLRTAGNRTPRIDETTAAQTVAFELRDADGDAVYTETVNLTVTDASGEFSKTDNLSIGTPTAVASRTNTTNVSLTTKTAAGTPVALIEETDLLPSTTTGASLGFDNDTVFALTAAAPAGVNLIDNLDGTFDLEITTEDAGTEIATGTTSMTLEARDTTPNTITGGPIAGPTDSSGSSTGTLTQGTATPALTAFALSNANTTNVSAVTALSAVTPAANQHVRVVGAPAWLSGFNGTGGSYAFSGNIDRTATGVPLGTQTLVLEYFDSAVPGTTIFTETITLTVNPYVQHSFSVNVVAADGTGEGALDGEVEVTAKTDNDLATPANLLTEQAVVGAGDTTAASLITLRTNQPTGTIPFTFDESRTNMTSATAVSSIAAADRRFAIGGTPPEGITLVDNLNGTFDVSLAVDNNGEFVPVDLTSFSIEVFDVAAPTTVVFTETYTMTMVDMMGHVTKTSGNEQTNGEIDIAMTAVEGGKTKIPVNRQSTALTSFKENFAGGTFSLSGTDAALFRVDETTGEVTSRSFLDNENPTDDGAGNVYDFNIVYTQGNNTFTDKVSLTITNDERDDVVTQAAGRPLVGQSAIDAASLVSEEEDLTIFGNVGTAVIDVNGGESAYDIVQSINAAQTETGVYANAQTRVNMFFPDQFEAVSDAVSFKLKGVNEESVLVSGSVDFGVTGGRDANVRSLADAINSVSGKTGITAKVSPNGAMLHMFSNDGYDIVVENFTTSVQNIPMKISASDGSLKSVGDVQELRKGTNETDTFRSTGEITFHSPYVFSIEAGRTGLNGGGLFQLTPGAADLVSVSELDVLTVDGAKKMLTAVDAALVRIDLERSDLGATMSRMEHTINNLSNIVVNTKAARSRIQDADIAEETTEMTKAQVLSQAAQAMLAQANRTSQSILSLLQG